MRGECAVLHRGYPAKLHARAKAGGGTRQNRCATTHGGHVVGQAGACGTANPRPARQVACACKGKVFRCARLWDVRAGSTVLGGAACICAPQCWHCTAGNAWQQCCQHCTAGNAWQHPRPVTLLRSTSSASSMAQAQQRIVSINVYINYLFPGSLRVRWQAAHSPDMPYLSKYNT